MGGNCPVITSDKDGKKKSVLYIRMMSRDEGSNIISLTEWCCLLVLGMFADVLVLPFRLAGVEWSTPFWCWLRVVRVHPALSPSCSVGCLRVDCRLLVMLPGVFWPVC
jgi:hypothetical protein